MPRITCTICTKTFPPSQQPEASKNRPTDNFYVLPTELILTIVDVRRVLTVLGIAGL